MVHNELVVVAYYILNFNPPCVENSQIYQVLPFGDWWNNQLDYPFRMITHTELFQGQPISGTRLRA